MANCLTIHIFQRTYLVKFKIGFFLLCLFFFVLTCALGTWQVHRYQYKQQLLSSYQQNLSEKPQSFLQIANKKNIEFQSIIVQGVYLNQLTIVIQNKFHDNKPGFEIITPFRVHGENKLLLVNRGWLEKKANQTIPKIQNINQEQHITGSIKLLNERQFILGKNILNANDPTNSILMMQKIDIQDIEKATQKEFFPYILRLDPSQSNGFVRDWGVKNIVPERHMAYALQWYLLALAVFIGFICFCCERVDGKK